MARIPEGLRPSGVLNPLLGEIQGWNDYNQLIKIKIIIMIKMAKTSD